MTRDLLFAVISNVRVGSAEPNFTLEFSVQPDRTTLLEDFKVVMRTYTAARQIPRSSPAPKHISTTHQVPDSGAGDVRFASWFRDPLPPELPGCSVPKPGVVLALIRPPDVAPDSWLSGPNDLNMVLGMARVLAETAFKGELKRFLDSPAAVADAVRPRFTRVFISHAAKDHDLAAEIRETLQQSGVDSFVASLGIEPGDIWADSIRDALRDCSAAIILLTPNSINSAWVMAEAGALWALDVPFIPAISYVALGDLPELITSRQCIDVSTAPGRKRCLDAVLQMASKDI